METEYSTRAAYRSHALRRGRFTCPGFAYLVTTATFEHRPLFASFERGCSVARALDFSYRENTLQSLAWVVMPDHLHWLLTVGEKKTISELMRSFKTCVARSLNRHDESPGRKVWQSGFYDHALRREEDLPEMARYIIGSPLRAGLVADIGDYPFWNAVWW